MPATSAHAPAVNPTVCPLCGQANQCAMELEKATGQPQGPCWCTQVDFSADLLSHIPTPARGVACVCAACAGTGREVLQPE